MNDVRPARARRPRPTASSSGPRRRRARAPGAPASSAADRPGRLAAGCDLAAARRRRRSSSADGSRSWVNVIDDLGRRDLDGGPVRRVGGVELRMGENGRGTGAPARTRSAANSVTDRPRRPGRRGHGPRVYGQRGCVPQGAERPPDRVRPGPRGRRRSRSRHPDVSRWSGGSGQAACRWRLRAVVGARARDRRPEADQPVAEPDAGRWVVTGPAAGNGRAGMWLAAFARQALRAAAVAPRA